MGIEQKARESIVSIRALANLMRKHGPSPSFADSLEKIADHLESALSAKGQESQQPAAPIGEAVGSDNRRERLLERRNVLNNSFGNGAYQDGRVQQQIDAIDAELAAPIGEAVGVLHGYDSCGRPVIAWHGIKLPEGTELYAAPQQAAGVDESFLPNGTRVEWQDNFGRWWPATITGWHPATYDARLDDGCDANGYARGRFRALAAQQQGGAE